MSFNADFGSGSSEITAEILNSRTAVSPLHDLANGKFNSMQSNHQSQDTHSLALIRVRPGQVAALPTLPRVPKL
jgi:hypothetical protein